MLAIYLLHVVLWKNKVQDDVRPMGILGIMWQVSTYFDIGITELGTFHTQEHNYTNTLIQFTQFLQI